MSPCPPYLFPLSRDVPSFAQAFEACVAACQDHAVPTHLCRQCYDEDWEKRVIAAAKLTHQGGRPQAFDYSQIYFEHPACSGGVETHKLFAPYGLLDMMTGCPPEGSPKYNYPEMLETLVRSGFWFWPEKLKTPFRALAARMFWDWFIEGRFEGVMRAVEGDYLGPGDDILTLCTLCQIDPHDIVRVLSDLHTPQADSALCGPLNFSATQCTYVAADTGAEQSRYQEATETIAATLASREASAFLYYVTEPWVDAAFFRQVETAPALAQDLSEFARYYDIRMQKLGDIAARPQAGAWPDLPVV